MSEDQQGKTKFHHFEGKVIHIFGYAGADYGNGWSTGRNLGTEENPDYMLESHSPYPETWNIREVLDYCKEKYPQKKIGKILISNVIAVKLFLQKILTENDFRTATEWDEFPTPFNPHRAHCNAITIEKVSLFETETYDLIIMEEKITGPDGIYLFDEKNDIIK